MTKNKKIYIKYCCLTSEGIFNIDEFKRNLYHYTYTYMIYKIMNGVDVYKDYLKGAYWMFKFAETIGICPNVKFTLESTPKKINSSYGYSHAYSCSLNANDIFKLAHQLLSEEDIEEMDERVSEMLIIFANEHKKKVA